MPSSPKESTSEIMVLLQSVPGHKYLELGVYPFIIPVHISFYRSQVSSSCSGSGFAIFAGASTEAATGVGKMSLAVVVEELWPVAIEEDAEVEVALEEVSPVAREEYTGVDVPLDVVCTAVNEEYSDVEMVDED